jgi:hypothetical protein
MDLLDEFEKQYHGQKMIIVIKLMWTIYGIIIYLCVERKVNN